MDSFRIAKALELVPKKTGVHADDRLADRDMVNHQNRGGRQKQKRQDQKKGNDVNPFFLTFSSYHLLMHIYPVLNLESRTRKFCFHYDPRMRLYY